MSKNGYLKILNRKLLTNSKSNIRGKWKYILLAIPIASFGLGVWQINRRNWKLELIENLETQLKSKPIVIETHNQLENSLSEYTTVRLQGVFDHSKEVFVGPRHLIDDFIPINKFMNHNISKVGYHVITPMKLSCNSQVVLINRGWVPTSKLDSGTRKKTQFDGVVEVEALVRKSEKNSVFHSRQKYSLYTPIESKKDPNKSAFLVFTMRDIDNIAQMLGTSSWFADAKFDKNIVEMGGPIGGQTRITLRNEHLQYILTWFTLGLATSFMYLKYVR